jgi:hypothetical protein
VCRVRELHPRRGAHAPAQAEERTASAGRCGSGILAGAQRERLHGPGVRAAGTTRERPSDGRRRVRGRRATPRSCAGDGAAESAARSTLCPEPLLRSRLRPRLVSRAVDPS